MLQVRSPAELGALARVARTARGWTQQQAADAAGVSRRFVNMLEGGGHANAELWRVLAVLDAVGVILVGEPPRDSSSVATVPSSDMSPASAAGRPSAPAGFDLDTHVAAFRRVPGTP